MFEYFISAVIQEKNRGNNIGYDNFTVTISDPITNMETIRAIEKEFMQERNLAGCLILNYVFMREIEPEG